MLIGYAGRCCMAPPSWRPIVPFRGHRLKPALAGAAARRLRQPWPGSTHLGSAAIRKTGKASQD